MDLELPATFWVTQTGQQLALQVRFTASRCG